MLLSPIRRTVQLIKKEHKRISKWVDLVEKHFRGRNPGEVETYHGLKQSDYVAIFAVDRKGGIVIVRQYRPMVERFTWEFPAGTVDQRESPLSAAKRELKEEAGFRGGTWTKVGTMMPDTGRLDLTAHNFLAMDVELDADFAPELESKTVTNAELMRMIREEEFSHQLHVGLVGAILAHKPEVFRCG